MKIEVRTDSFVLRDGFWSRKTVPWSAIVAIHARCVSRITYDEVFLVFELDNGKQVSVAELDTNFRAFEEALCERIPDIDKNWRARAEAETGQATELWRA